MRQVERRALFDKHFKRLVGGQFTGTLAHPLPARSDRRNLARALAAKEWRARLF